MTGLKPKVDNLDIDKIKTVPADLSKLSNVVVNDVVKKTVYDKLVTKFNPFGRMCVPYKREGVNLKIFNMTKEINESKTLIKHISCECKYGLDARKCNSRQKWNNYKCQCESKKLIRHQVRAEDYAWNCVTCACECDTDCDIGE